jgi:hypothetical protein
LADRPQRPPAVADGARSALSSDDTLDLDSLIRRVDAALGDDGHLL